MTEEHKKEMSAPLPVPVFSTEEWVAGKHLSRLKLREGEWSYTVRIGLNANLVLDCDSEGRVLCIRVLGPVVLTEEERQWK